MMLTLCALGVRISWPKAQRGHEIIWIGVQFHLDWDSKIIVLEIPERMLNKLKCDLVAFENQEMISFKRLQSFTGKLSWVAGVLRHTRSVVRALYAVLSSVKSELLDGTEERRRKARVDTRDKSHL
eukprot:12555082-Heterocapsa_arctica.AAC.1